MGARGGATKPPEEVAREHSNLAVCRLQELTDLQQAARTLNHKVTTGGEIFRPILYTLNGEMTRIVVELNRAKIPFEWKE